jgi:RNA recognition motif-containing protein
VQQTTKTKNMSIKLYVGNLAFATDADQLRNHFSQYGNVEDSFVASDRETGRSRGFGFVTFTNKEDGEAAITATNGQDLGGRKLVVNEARPMEQRSGGGGGYGGGGGRRGGGGGYGNNSGYNNRRDNDGGY